MTSTRPLGLGSKLYPSDMLHMLNKDLTRFMQIISRLRQNRGRQGETIRDCEQSTEAHLLTIAVQNATKTTFF